jgi:hypothetical protein
MIFACYYQCRSSWILKRFNRYWVKIQNRNKLVTICYSIVVTIVHHIWPSLVLRFDRIIHWTFSISLWYYLSSVEVSGHVEGSERSCGRKWAVMWEEVSGHMGGSGWSCGRKWAVMCEEVSGHVGGSEWSCGRKWAVMWEEVSGHMGGSEQSCGRKWAVMWEEVSDHVGGSDRCLYWFSFFLRFWYFILELFRQCGIFYFSLYPNSIVYIIFS